MRTILLPAIVLAVTTAVSAQAPDPLKRSGFLGTAVGPVSAEVSQAQGMKDRAGVAIVRIMPKSSAEAAGLKAGDVIVAIDGKKVGGVPQFLALAGRRRAGEKIEVEYLRGAKHAKAAFELAARELEKSDLHETIYGSVTAKAGRLRTIATKPKTGSGRRPALFVIQGIGGYSIESVPPAPAMYAPFIDEFSRDGWATFRVDKPGQGDSEGGPTQDVDFETELDGYRQALKALKSLDFVDPDRIVIFGHSMGGAMGPLLAAHDPVRGLAVYGTLSKTWTEYMLENLRRQMTLAGTDPGDIESLMRDDAAIHYLVTLGGKTPSEVAKENPALAPRVHELFQEEKYMAGRTYLFFRQLAERNLAEAWRNFDGHALAIWGKADFVSTEEDHLRIAKIVDDRKAGRGKALSLDGIDHGFLKSDSQRASQESFGKPGGEFNPIVVEKLKAWADSVVKGKE